VKTSTWNEPRVPSAFYTGGPESDVMSSRTSIIKLGQIAVSDRRTLGGLTQFLTQFGVSGSATGL
jgi:hypothetical protein